MAALGGAGGGAQDTREMRRLIEQEALLAQVRARWLADEYDVLHLARVTVCGCWFPRILRFPLAHALPSLRPMDFGEFPSVLR